MFVWSEQRGNDHFWSYQANKILCSFFCFPQLCLFPKVEEFRGQLILFYKYQSHDSGELLCGVIVCLCGFFCFVLFAQMEPFLSLVYVNICFPHPDAFLLPLLWRKRSLISQFKYFSVCGDSYTKKEVFQ